MPCCAWPLPPFFYRALQALPAALPCSLTRQLVIRLDALHKRREGRRMQRDRQDGVLSVCDPPFMVNVCGGGGGWMWAGGQYLYVCACWRVRAWACLCTRAPACWVMVDMLWRMAGARTATDACVHCMGCAGARPHPHQPTPADAHLQVRLDKARAGQAAIQEGLRVHGSAYSGCGEVGRRQHRPRSPTPTPAVFVFVRLFFRKSQPSH